MGRRSQLKHGDTYDKVTVVWGERRSEDYLLKWHWQYDPFLYGAVRSAARVACRKSTLRQLIHSDKSGNIA